MYINYTGNDIHTERCTMKCEISPGAENKPQLMNAKVYIPIKRITFLFNDSRQQVKMSSE